MSQGWNYASSKEQLNQEFLRMYKSLTDPEERKKLRILRTREERREAIAKDVGL